MRYAGIKITIIFVFLLSAFYFWLLPLQKAIRRPNILLVVIDTLRADHLGCNGYFRDTSPNIDHLAREGLIFNHCYSQAGWTLPSFTSIFTSLYPKDHGVTDWKMVLDSSLTTLTEALKDQGYHTCACPSMFHLDTGSGFEQGFDVYHTEVARPRTERGTATSPKVNELVLTDIKKARRPFFIWAHYFDPHSLYLSHPGYEFGEDLVDKYDSEIAFVDAHIGQLIEELKERDLYDNTVIIITADHGEEFQDHGGRHHHTLYQEIIHIPLIIRVPGLEPRIIEEPVEQIDLAPTILGLAGIDIPKAFHGRDILMQRSPDHKIFAERGGGELAYQQAVIDGDFKLYEIDVADADPNSERYKMQNITSSDTMLFDLYNDPGEYVNLRDDSLYLYSSLRSQFESFYDPDYKPNQQVAVFDEETVEELKALGYIR